MKAIFRRRPFHSAPGAPSGDPAEENPWKVDPTSGMYASETDRLGGSKSEKELRSERLERYKKDRVLLERKRVDMADKEEERWKRMADEKKAVQKKLDDLQLTQKAKRNKQSMPYNPITLEYHDGLDGQRLKHVDDSVVYRAVVRQRVLQAKSTGTHNPLTGLPVQLTPLPTRPETPDALRKANANHSKIEADSSAYAPPPPRRVHKRDNPALAPMDLSKRGKLPQPAPWVPPAAYGAKEPNRTPV